MDFDVKSRLEGGWEIVDVGGQVDASTAPRLREHLIKTIEAGQNRVVVNMLSVSFMDSSGLAVLLGGLRRVAERDGTMKLVSGNGPVHRLLSVTSLDKIFPVHRTVPEAIASD